jgi:hypothetical protein
MMDVDVVRRKSLHLVRYCSRGYVHLVLLNCLGRTHVCRDETSLIINTPHEAKFTETIKHALDEFHLRVGVLNILPSQDIFGVYKLSSQ